MEPTENSDQLAEERLVGPQGGGDRSHTPPKLWGDTTFSAERFLTLMDQNNVEKAVLLQGGFLGFANDYLSQVVSTYPTRFAASATFDPFCRNAQKILDNLIQTYRIFKFEMSTGCGIMEATPPIFPPR